MAQQFICSRCRDLYDRPGKCTSFRCDGDLRPYAGVPELFDFECKYPNCGHQPKLPLSGGDCPLGHGPLERVEKHSRTPGECV